EPEHRVDHALAVSGLVADQVDRLGDGPGRAPAELLDLGAEPLVLLDGRPDRGVGVVECHGLRLVQLAAKPGVLGFELRGAFGFGCGCGRHAALLLSPNRGPNASRNCAYLPSPASVSGESISVWI